MRPTLISTDLILWHRLLQAMPRWSDESPEMAALAEDVARRGIDQPLLVCASQDGGESPGYYYLLDGRHRHRAACLAGLAEVPVIHREEEDALSIIIGSLTQRRHLSKGALAYVSWPLFADQAKPNGGDRKSEAKKSECNDCTLILEDIAHRLGVSRRLVILAKEAHEAFAGRQDLRARFEPDILSGELALHRLPGAIAGRESTYGKARATPDPTELLLAGFDTIATRFARWEKIGGGERQALSAAWARTVYELPEDIQRSTYESLASKFK